MARRSIILGSIGSASQAEIVREDANIIEVIPPQELILAPKESSQEDDENDSLDSSVSSLSQEDEDESPLSVPSKPRSIFGNYWKAGGECPPKKIIPPTRSVSPMCVMADPYYQPPYSSPTLDMLLSGHGVEQQNEDDDSMNTYERTLKSCEVLPNWRLPTTSPYENAPLWMSWFTKRNASAPTLGLRGLGGPLTRSRYVQSDSALHTTPLKSALRQGRFSGGVAKTSTTSLRNHVHFQPRIQVCSYQPPVESWAAEGWSQWFGS